MKFFMFIQPFCSLLSTLLTWKYFNPTLQLPFLLHFTLKWSHELKRNAQRPEWIGVVIWFAELELGSSPGHFFSNLTALMTFVPNCTFEIWSLQQKARLPYPKSQKLNLNQQFFPTAAAVLAQSDLKNVRAFQSTAKWKFWFSRSQPINYLIITTQTL